MEKQKPVHQVRKGLVSASLFERKVKGKNGIFTSKSVALNISVPQEGGKFKQNNITIVKKDFNNVLDALKEIKEHL